MKSFAVITSLLWFVSLGNSSDAVNPYDFRESEAYKTLSDAERDNLEAVHRDFTLLWGALDRYADDHGDCAPVTLEDLVPLYLRSLPKDPFAPGPLDRDKDTGAYVASLDGGGYLYRRGTGRSWITASVGLPAFPYLAARGNIGLYMPKGTWISGMQLMVLPE